jgi:dTDP-4-dehydrorhamnose 3,5-epimerase
VKITPTPLEGLLVVESTSFVDPRGAFARRYCERELAEVLDARRVVQINQSRTHAVGAVRGMHFQRPPHAEMKLIWCVHGKVLDVAVDLRRGSPTLLRWHAVELSPASGRMMVIPEGFAHGFQVLEADSELVYLHTAFYAPEAEGGVPHDDPALGIAWPLPAVDLSARDRSHPPIGPGFEGIAP